MLELEGTFVTLHSLLYFQVWKLRSTDDNRIIPYPTAGDHFSAEEAEFNERHEDEGTPLSTTSQ